MTSEDRTALTDADREYLERFERCEIPLEEWTHRAHLRVAWAYLRAAGLEGAIERMRKGIPRFNASHAIGEGLDRGYHDTLTVAFIRVIDTTMRVYGTEPNADAFIDRHTQLHSGSLLRLFYSRSRLMSWEAKHGFVEPDLAPLPSVPSP